MPENYKIHAPNSIPKSIELGQRLISTILDGGLIYNTDDAGQAIYRHNEIKLQAQGESSPIPDSSRAEIYWHEVAHWLMFMMQEDELRKNEAFCSRLGIYLQQIYNTMEI